MNTTRRSKSKTQFDPVNPVVEMEQAVRMTNQENLQASLKGIQHLLSHLHGEVAALETSYTQVLLVLQKLESAVATDDLTGLLRRNAFFKRWEHLLEECQEVGESCAILLVDIDHFKKINDTHGHPTGDEVIKRIAGLLKDFETPRSFTGRLGGEEFAVVIRGSDAEALGMAEMIRRGAERLHGPVLGKDGEPGGNVDWRCTVSVGMASSSSERSFEADALIQSADRALYEAKEKGRNQVRAA